MDVRPILYYVQFVIIRLSFRVDPAGYAGKQDFGENLKQLWLEPLQLISPSSLLNKEERARSFCLFVFLSFCLFVSLSMA